MKSAALLINLGSPKSTDPRDVKEYLDEFLMDPMVIDLPYFWRSLLIRGIVLKTRPKRSAHAYASVWWDEGSPLIVLSRRLQAGVQGETEIPVYLAMRYAEPSISATLNTIVEQHPDLEKLFVIPLYPHYAMSSYGTVQNRVESECRKLGAKFKLQFKAPFYDDEVYLSILTDSIREKLPEDHHLLFSYHGLPERHIRKCDPTRNHCLVNADCCETESPSHALCYRFQAFETTNRVSAMLNLEEGKYSTSFQSRLGPDKWLEPFTSKQLKLYPEQGIKKLAVVCPAFVSDCLETLEEIDIRGRADFLDAGGESFVSIPCLNDRQEWSVLLSGWINEVCVD